MFVQRLIPALILASALCAPLAAGAQSSPAPAPASSEMPAGGHHHHHRHQSAFFRALSTVNLTPDQQAQVDAFRTQEHTANANADAATKQANAAKMRDQITGILTPDQKTQLQTAMHHAHNVPPKGAASPAPNAN